MLKSAHGNEAGALSRRLTVSYIFRLLTWGGALLVLTPVACLALGLPDDASDRMAMAAKSNGLSGPDVKPWHARIGYKLFDEQGTLKSEGTIDELWVSPAKFKVTYTSGPLSHVEYETDKGMYTMGGAGMDIVPAFKIQRALIDPLPPPQTILPNQYAFQKREIGTIGADCLQQQDVDGHSFGPTWCFEHRSAGLRVVANANSEDVLYSNLRKFQGRTIAGDVKFSAGELRNIESDAPAFSAHLETIELLRGIDEEAFTPPADAHAPVVLGGVIGSSVPNSANAAMAPRKITISGGVAQGNLIQKAPVQYPQDAKMAGISGTVVLQALIDTEGRVNDLHVISGPPELQQAAVDSVRAWRYRPYLLNGNPVSVNTTINIVFALSK